MHHKDPNGPTAAGEAHKGTLPGFMMEGKELFETTGQERYTYLPGKPVIILESRVRHA
jgi:hypothetical protein